VSICACHHALRRIVQGSQCAQGKTGERVANLMTYPACARARVPRHVTGTHFVYEWDTCVDPRVGRDVLQMRKIPSPAGIQAPNLPARTPITIPTAIHWLLVINTVRSFPYNSLPISCRTPSHQQWTGIFITTAVRTPYLAQGRFLPLAVSVKHSCTVQLNNPSEPNWEWSGRYR